MEKIDISDYIKIKNFSSLMTCKTVRKPKPHSGIYDISSIEDTHPEYIKHYYNKVRKREQNRKKKSQEI